MDSRLSCGQSDLGSIPAIDKLFSINCETLNFRDFVSVISFRWFRLGIGFGDIVPVNERREEGIEWNRDYRVLQRREEVRVCVKEKKWECV